MNRTNLNKARIKYIIKDVHGRISCLAEHEFKHFIRHNNLKLQDYTVAGFSTITNSYNVYINKQANSYVGQRTKIKNKK